MSDIEDDVGDWSTLGDSIPRRGEKEFEPDGSDIQALQLKTARDAMYNTLKEVRLHHVKQKLFAVWYGNGSIVPFVKGNLFKDLGEPLRGRKGIQGVFLNPVETVYLVERGSMAVVLGDDKFGQFLDNDETEFDYESLKPLTLSHLYSLASTDPELMNHHQVFSYLKRHGYLVRPFRHLKNSSPMDVTPVGILSFPRIIYNKFKLLALYLFQKMAHAMSWGPTLGINTNFHYLNYTSVFRSLRLHNLANNVGSSDEPEFQLNFNVWKPTPSFSKKNPPPPDFQVCIVDTDTTQFPKLATIKRLLDQANQQAHDEPKGPKKTSGGPTKKEVKLQKRQEYQRKLDPRIQKRNSYLAARDKSLKTSERSVIIASVSNGVVSFCNIGESDFTLQNTSLSKFYSRDHGIIWMEKNM